MSLVSLKGVGKSFGKEKILGDINLDIKKGEVVGIVGPSGAGKSVLVKMLIGFLKPSEGEITFQMNPLIGFSMQDNSLYDHLTVDQNAKYFSKIYGVPREDWKARIPRLIESLNLKDFEKVLVKNLSGGTKKRADLVCSLLNNPDILILDEPFLGLDPSLVKALSKYITDLNRQGKTIIISSHRTNELSRLASRILMVKDKTLKEITKSEINNAYI